MLWYGLKYSEEKQNMLKFYVKWKEKQEPLLN